MKRILAVLLGALVSVSALAQTDSRKLIAGVYDFATVASKEWNIMNPSFKAIDPAKEKIVFKGSFLEKGLPGLYDKYDFTCTVAREADDFSVLVTELSSVVVTKNMNRSKNSKRLTWSDATAAKYAPKMKAEISKRMASWTDAEYEQKLNEAVTSPMLLGGIGSGNALAFKKFIKDYDVIGRHVSVKIYVTGVDEAPYNIKGYEYCVNGKVLRETWIEEHTENLIDMEGYEYTDVTVYTNNDDVISLPASKTSILSFADLSSNPVYEVNGTIKDVLALGAPYGTIVEITE
ncbi:MAG: hypothetical protein K6G18_01750 [Treponema sp.]|nr:hypothetical protein [Treponema sp.]